MGEVFIIFGVFLVVLAAAGITANVKRGNALRELAAGKQWDMTKNDRVLPGTFGGQPLASGHSRVARLVLRGVHNDHAVLVFDYEYKTPGSDGDDTHRYWVASIEDLPVSLPALEVVPRAYPADLARRNELGVLNGYPGTSIGDPEFDRRYLVRTQNPRLAADVLGRDVVRLLLSWPDLAWRIEGTRLLTWGSGRMRPAWVQTQLNMLATLADTVPPEVWRIARG